MKLWWMLVIDGDRKVFALHGPISDDTEWTNKVAVAQGRGRHVICSTIPASEDPSAIKERTRTRGYGEGAIDLT
jgi:hypothetical protein